MNYCIIMAGGIGSRFWPLSRTEKPKQFVDALGIGKTFIQMTYERFARFVPDANFLVMTGENYKELVLEQLPMLKPEQVLTEPMRRNTAPCIAYATYRLCQENPEATVVVTPSDQYIGDEDTFEKVICRNLDYAHRNDALVTVGITPTFPATGYGYIQVEDKEKAVSKVVAFKEKPELTKAQEFLADGNYVWNSGMFIWSLKSIRKAFETHLPDVATLFAAADTYGTPGEQEAVNRAFTDSRSISIDYGVMEKAENVYVSCAEFGWSDVGTWGSLYQQMEKDEAENVVSGDRVHVENSSGCLLKETNKDKQVVVDGLEDFLVVDTPDVLMICPREDEERIKKLIETVS